MDLFNRITLKNFFRTGSVPTEVHFSNLIDSTINKIDDGFSKSAEDGLKLTPNGESGKLISFYEGVKGTSTEASWSLIINPGEVARGLSVGEKAGNSRLFFKEGGNVGVGTVMPSHKLEVEGTVAAQARVGTYNNTSEVPADGEWHIILDDLEACHAFEIVAKAEGVKKRGKYAISHAIAVSTHGNMGSSIRITQAYYGWVWHRIKFRWRKAAHGRYRLETKTVGHYGMDNDDEVIPIKFHITSLWDKSFDVKK